MKCIFTFSLFFTVSILLHSQTSTQFEISGKDGLLSKNLILAGDNIYFTAISDSANIYSTHLAKWNIATEKIEWSKKLNIDKNVSIHPVKILAYQDGSFVLVAYDYSWKNGFTNGNHTFLHFDKNGNIIKSKRLGVANGGIVRDAILDDKDNIVFLGERINQLYEYRTILGKLNKDFDIVTITSVFKDFYTYCFALDKDKDGNIFTIGHTKPLNGSQRSIVSKWDKNLNHIQSVTQLDADPNSTFNYLHVDDKGKLHIGGNLGNLVTYVRMDNNLKYEYGHEFYYSHLKNIWKDNNDNIHLFIEGTNDFVKINTQNEVSLNFIFTNIGTSNDQYYDINKNMIHNLSYYNTEADRKNRLLLNSILLKNTNECFIQSRSGGLNSPLRLDSFGIVNVVVRAETMTAVIPDDIIVSAYDLQTKEICKIIEISNTKEFRRGETKAYPNPANNVIAFEMPSTDDLFSIDLYNAQGIGVLHIPNLSNKENVDISALTSGFYTAYIKSSDDKIFISKICIIK